MTLTEIHARCEPDGDCLLWTGMGQGKHPQVRVRHPETGQRMRLSVRRLVWSAVHGEDATGPLKTMCGNAMCLSPAHIVMPSPVDTTSLTSIHARCEPMGDCLIWTGRRGNGLPFTPGGGGTSLRPVVWGLAGKGEPPMFISTNCGNAMCLNPEHLTPAVRNPGPPRPQRDRAEVMRELLEPSRQRGRAFHSGPLVLPLPVRETKARIGTESAANYGGIVPPNSAESFAICDAVRQEIVGPDEPGMARPWLIGRSR